MKTIRLSQPAIIKPGYFSLLIIMLISLALITASCGEPAGIIKVGGSTTVKPLAEKLAEMYIRENPKISIVIQGGGSGAGISGASKGEFDIGMASRELTAEDPVLVKHILGKDAIAVIVNKSNTITSLSKEQVIKIFAGKISNWNELGGPTKSIHVISREAGSGTRASFEEMVMGKEHLTPNAVSQNSNASVKDSVSADDLAIGYLSLGQLDQSVKAVDINGISCNTANAISGQYPIVRPLYFLTKAEPGGPVKKFIEYCQGPASQATIIEAGYISVK